MNFSTLFRRVSTSGFATRTMSSKGKTGAPTKKAEPPKKAPPAPKKDAPKKKK